MKRSHKTNENQAFTEFNYLNYTVQNDRDFFSSTHDSVAQYNMCLSMYEHSSGLLFIES